MRDTMHYMKKMEEAEQAGKEAYGVMLIWSTAHHTTIRQALSVFMLSLLPLTRVQVLPAR